MQILKELKAFTTELFKFIIKFFHLRFFQFQKGKGIFVSKLYRQRGRMSKNLIHVGMTALAVLGILIGPYIAKEFPGRSVDPWKVNGSSSQVLLASSDTNISTNVTNSREGIIDYQVQAGDTISSIAEKFGISVDTIRWANDLGSSDTIKQNETLKILPVTGIAHKVEKGDTVESISKKYGLPSAEAVVEFPFNTFVNDETFALAIGQTIIVPNGNQPRAGQFQAAAVAVQITPNAGTVTATGNFVWPTQGVITQGFFWYHPGVDIANPAEPNVLAADSGRVIHASWDTTGYGNMIMIDHGNGVQTLYGHLSAFYVTVGQTVNRGDAIGRMGSTGHSTGPHLHFEVRINGVHQSPFNYLK